MKTLTRTKTILLSAVLVIGVTGAACSDDEEPKATKTTDAPESTDKTDDTKAKGSITPVEGDQEVSIADYTFGPEELTVKSGTKVTWANADDFAHTATSKEAPAEFDTGELEKGESGEFTFDAPGTYKYQCDIHDYMKGTIEVVAG